MSNTEKSIPATAAALGAVSLLWIAEVSSAIGRISLFYSLRSELI
jgi:hypothetical protein